MDVRDKLPIIVTVVAILVAILILGYNSRSTVKEDIASLQAYKQVLDKQMKIYDNINKNYGAASKNFYSSKSVVVLHGKGATATIPVYWAKSKEAGISYNISSNKILSCKWGAWRDNHWTDLTITSNIDRGYETIIFSNKANKETFKVLVIVR